ncbi:alpha-ketoglutarate-dependent dioxygenase AlkB [Undibacterium sp. Jales W-56]|uniref:alpha-ketoglutarate-dependent dioxygenase AlkB family protein n=1 Tax=Undibacterium sp. Jales W-56 TaxID=2897325 RepID=UPI0021CE109D|nr:alpha-ketoglutarate-dependent dioxygenase AlkB [Undibacterium sp. Jales W-56]MCU6435633.1 alpha-ketoglutarate-dependent dioxygenase AlkB [Undibacterium sp. Jales W-56]
MPDLFSAPNSLEQLAISDGELAFAHEFYTAEQATDLFHELLNTTPWRQDPITVWGKTHLQPRLTAWYGDNNSSYEYSGLALDPFPWPPTLLSIKQAIEDLTQHRYNSVLLNLYRDQYDSVGWHSDDEPELGQSPVIASLSLGETRRFKLRHKNKPAQKPLTIALTNGSVLLMAGDLQRYWEHAVPKESRFHAARINLTFRSIFR